jgi:hypothetical protein
MRLSWLASWATSRASAARPVRLAGGVWGKEGWFGGLFLNPAGADRELLAEINSEGLAKGDVPGAPRATKRGTAYGVSLDAGTARAEGRRLRGCGRYGGLAGDFHELGRAGDIIQASKRCPRPATSHRRRFPKIFPSWRGLRSEWEEGGLPAGGLPKWMEFAIMRRLGRAISGVSMVRTA